jgi:hypothetical protein
MTQTNPSGLSNDLDGKLDTQDPGLASGIAAELQRILENEERDRLLFPPPPVDDLEEVFSDDEELIIDTDDEDGETRMVQEEGALVENEPKKEYWKRMGQTRRERNRQFKEW